MSIAQHTEAELANREFWQRKMEEQFAARKARHEFEQAAKEFLSPLPLVDVLRGVASGAAKDPDRDRYEMFPVCDTCGVNRSACMCQAKVPSGLGAGILKQQEK